MEFSLIADTVSVFTAKQSIVFAKSLLLNNRSDSANQISFSDSSADQSLVGIVQATTVRSSSYKTIRRIRKKRRTRRVSFSGDSEDGGGGGGDFSRFLLEGDFGGGGDGGKGWNSGGGSGGGGNWDDSSSSSSSWSDPAMGFVYEVICWIALSNCVHFAFKRIVRIVTDGEREKLNITLTPVC
ncbi:unnamed protein product [Cochlearia groenlandica]